MRIVPTQCALGAELQGIDLAQDLIEDDVLKVRSAWLDHGVVFFRNQAITDKMLVRFSRRIGEPEPSPASERARVGGGSAAEFPEVWVISNVVENGKPIGSLGSGEAEWHTDMSYAARPPIASVLHALEIPLTGGDTHFASVVFTCTMRFPTCRRNYSRKFRAGRPITTRAIPAPVSFESGRIRWLT